MNRKLAFSLLLTLSWAFAWSQARQVSGRVLSDSAQQPVSGATVTLRGTGTSTSTNNEGRYTISVPSSGGTLVFSSVGFTTQNATVGNRLTIDVTLATSAGAALSDVVVVGYASVRRRDLTGSVSSVSQRQIKDVPLASAAEALQGRLAGVQVTSAEGAPGAEVVIRVRGGGSITQDNAPLYIVDGVQVENALSVIAPQDIASVDVLKDASTTSIYGARGANGVILITTKSGRGGKTVVTYTGQVGFRELPQTMDVLSPYEFVRWQYERSRGTTTEEQGFARLYGTTWDTLENYKNVQPLNWQQEVFGRRAGFQNHNVSVSGGTAATNFSLSLTSNKEDGIQLETGYNRNLVNFKLDHRISDKVRFGVNARYLDQDVLGIGTSNTGTRTTNRLRHTITYRPFEVPVPGGGAEEFDEEYYLASSGATNPVLLTKAEYRNAKTRATYLTGNLTITPIRNLTFRSTAGYDNTGIRQTQFFSRITNTARNFASLPVAITGDQTNSSLNISNTLQYSLNQYKKHHDISVLVGQEIVERQSRNIVMESRFLPADITASKALSNMGLSTPPSGQANPFPSSNVNPLDRIFSLFGRVNYSYQGKYLATFNLRADRSSKFPSQNGTLIFPSGSVAWRLSQEKFMKDVTWINDAKLRFGYGAVGNNRIGDLLYLQLYGVSGQYAFNHSLVPGFAPTALANPNLRWETNITRNLGLDLSILRNRVQLTIDAYKNSANDLLLSVAIPPTTGYTSQIQNIGSTSNRGLEIQLNVVPVQTKNFNWNSNFNISFNRNRVESLGGPMQITRNSGWQGSDGVDDYLVKVGQPVGLMFGFQNDGFYKVEDFNYNAATSTYTLKPGIAVNSNYGTPQPGMLKWKDISGPNGVPDGVVTSDWDRTVIGNANPSFIGGWNNQFSYKNFDANIFVNFVVGNDLYNANKIEWTNGSFANLNMLDITRTRFTNINDQGQVVTDPSALAKLNESATIWSPVRAQRFWLDSWAIEDGSYLRVNNVTIGYTLPGNVTSRAKISSLRMFATVNNLATLTRYTGYDPDVTARRA
jgi:TonB-linked SusC/RagA family outer membrane protein